MVETELVAVDLGGTHARFARAWISAAGAAPRLAPPCTFLTADFASFATCWEAFGRAQPTPLPRHAAIAVAAPIAGDVLKMTNNPWRIRPASLQAELDLDRLLLINDFAAIGHAVGALAAADLQHIAGPDTPLPAHGTISVIGPGTGLGVAQIFRRPDGNADILATEGGHIDFAPLDSLEDSILSWLRARYRRVSVERIVSGPGLANIYQALAALEGRAITHEEDKALWTRAIAGADSLAAAALSRFCLSFGSVAGDLALAHGAAAVVLAGGIVPRIADILPHSGFAERFAAKGRFERAMSAIPVRTITHPQPGLLGAAAAFAEAEKGEGLCPSTPLGAARPDPRN